MSWRANNHGLVRGLSRTSKAKTRRTGAAKSLALLLIVAAGSAPLFASWHETAVSHVRCAEHDELTDARAPHVHKIAAGRQASSSLQSEENADSSAGHHHCDIAFVARGRARIEAVRAAVRGAPPQTLSPPTDVRGTPPAQVRVWATAPKTSPPLV